MVPGSLPRNATVSAVDGPSNPEPRIAMTSDIAALYARREGDRNSLHSRYLNDQMVRMLRTIGYDVGFCRAEGAVSL